MFYYVLLIRKQRDEYIRILQEKTALSDDDLTQEGVPNIYTPSYPCSMLPIQPHSAIYLPLTILDHDP